VLAAMVQRTDLERHLGLLAEAGIDPKVVDLAPLATLNVLQLVEKDLPDRFIYVGGTPRQLTVALYRDKRLVGLRTVLVSLTVDGEETHEGNGRSASGDWVTRVVSEIRWTLTALNDAAVERGTPCFIGGKGIQFDELSQALQSGLELATRRLEPRESPRFPRELKGDAAAFAVPLGLALREVVPNEALGLNFRRGEFTYHRAQEEVRRAVGRCVALLGVVLCLVVISTFMEYRRLQVQARSLENGVRDVVAQTLPEARNAPDPARLLRQAIEDEKKKMAVLGDVAPLDGGTVVDAMRTVALALPASVKIDADEFVMDPGSIRLKAVTDSFESADAIKQKIAATDYFAEVQVKDVKQSKDGQSVNFRLILVFKGPNSAGQT